MKKEQAFIKSGEFNIYTEMYRPEKLKNDWPVLCFCHGIPAMAYNPKDLGYALLAEHFCSLGFDTFIFNFRGTGLSQGNFDILGWADDLRQVVDYLKTKDEIKEKKLVTIGFSGGAAVSVYVAAGDDRISSVATLACPATFTSLPYEKIDEIITHFRSIGVIKDDMSRRSKEKWFEHFSKISPINFVQQISPRALFIVHGDKDETVPVGDAFKLFKRAEEPKKLDIISGAGHRLRLESRAVGAIFRWLKSGVSN